MTLNAKLLLVLAAFSVFLSIVVCGRGMHNFNYLGTVQGKSNFSETGIQRVNWTTAREYCQNSSMEMATITTRMQNDFLIDAATRANLSTPGVGFWTAARDALNYSQFVWDHDGEVVNGTDLPDLALYIQMQSCIAWGANTPNFQAHLCNGAAFILCQVQGFYDDN